MDLQILKDIQKKTSALTQQRHGNAHAFSRVGLKILAQAQAEGFKDREMLKKACEHLMNAIQHNRNQPDPYVGIAYIFLLFGEYQEAGPYLKEALLIDPNHADAQNLLEQFNQPQQPISPTPESEFPSGFRLETAEDFDLLYDHVELLIQEKIQQLLMLPPERIQLTSALEDFTYMDMQYMALLEQYSWFIHDIEVVEEEIDCSELRSMLRPLDVTLERYKSVLNQSSELVDIAELIQSEIRWVCLVLRQLNKNRFSIAESYSEARFEQLLENCDFIADQLDAFETKGHDIQPLIVEYEHMLRVIAELQDQLD